jgi:xanthine dehydrogenase YagR molybdenum-binding subunit
MDNSLSANAGLEHVRFTGGRIVLAADPTRTVTFAKAMRAGGVDRIEAEASVASRGSTPLA